MSDPRRAIARSSESSTRSSIGCGCFWRSNPEGSLQIRHTASRGFANVDERGGAASVQEKLTSSPLPIRATARSAVLKVPLERARSARRAGGRTHGLARPLCAYNTREDSWTEMRTRESTRRRDIFAIAADGDNLPRRMRERSGPCTSPHAGSLARHAGRPARCSARDQVLPVSYGAAGERAR